MNGVMVAGGVRPFTKARMATSPPLPPFSPSEAGPLGEDLGIQSEEVKRLMGRLTALMAQVQALRDGGAAERTAKAQAKYEAEVQRLVKMQEALKKKLNLGGSLRAVPVVESCPAGMRALTDADFESFSVLPPPLYEAGPLRTDGAVCYPVEVLQNAFPHLVRLEDVLAAVDRTRKDEGTRLAGGAGRRARSSSRSSSRLPLTDRARRAAQLVRAGQTASPSSHFLILQTALNDTRGRQAVAREVETVTSQSLAKLVSEVRALARRAAGPAGAAELGAAASPRDSIAAIRAQIQDLQSNFEAAKTALHEAQAASPSDWKAPSTMAALSPRSSAREAVATAETVVARAEATLAPVAAHVEAAAAQLEQAVASGAADAAVAAARDAVASAEAVHTRAKRLLLNLKGQADTIQAKLAAASSAASGSEADAAVEQATEVATMAEETVAQAMDASADASAAVAAATASASANASAPSAPLTAPDAVRSVRMALRTGYFLDVKAELVYTLDMTVSNGKFLNVVQPNVTQASLTRNAAEPSASPTSTPTQTNWSSITGSFPIVQGPMKATQLALKLLDSFDRLDSSVIAADPGLDLFVSNLRAERRTSEDAAGQFVAQVFFGQFRGVLSDANRATRVPQDNDFVVYFAPAADLRAQLSAFEPSWSSMTDPAVVSKVFAAASKRLRLVLSRSAQAVNGSLKNAIAPFIEVVFGEAFLNTDKAIREGILPLSVMETLHLLVQANAADLLHEVLGNEKAAKIAFNVFQTFQGLTITRFNAKQVKERKLEESLTLTTAVLLTLILSCLDASDTAPVVVFARNFIEQGVVGDGSSAPFVYDKYANDVLVTYGTTPVRAGTAISSAEGTRYLPIPLRVAYGLISAAVERLNHPTLAESTGHVDTLKIVDPVTLLTYLFFQSANKMGMSGLPLAEDLLRFPRAEAAATALAILSQPRLWHSSTKEESKTYFVRAMNDALHGTGHDYKLVYEDEKMLELTDPKNLRIRILDVVSYALRNKGKFGNLLFPKEVWTVQDKKANIFLNPKKNGTAQEYLVDGLLRASATVEWVVSQNTSTIGPDSKVRLLWTTLAQLAVAVEPVDVIERLSVKDDADEDEDAASLIPRLSDTQRTLWTAALVALQAKKETAKAVMWWDAFIKEPLEAFLTETTQVSTEAREALVKRDEILNDEIVDELEEFAGQELDERVQAAMTAIADGVGNKEAYDLIGISQMNQMPLSVQRIMQVFAMKALVESGALVNKATDPWAKGQQSGDNKIGKLIVEHWLEKDTSATEFLRAACAELLALGKTAVEAEDTEEGRAAAQARARTYAALVHATESALRGTESVFQTASSTYNTTWTAMYVSGADAEAEVRKPLQAVEELMLSDGLVTDFMTRDTESNDEQIEFVKDYTAGSLGARKKDMLALVRLFGLRTDGDDGGRAQIQGVVERLSSATTFTELWTAVQSVEGSTGEILKFAFLMSSRTDLSVFRQTVMYNFRKSSGDARAAMLAQARARRARTVKIVAAVIVVTAIVTAAVMWYNASPEQRADYIKQAEALRDGVKNKIVGVWNSLTWDNLRATPDAAKAYLMQAKDFIAESRVGSFFKYLTKAGEGLNSGFAGQTPSPLTASAPGVLGPAAGAEGVVQAADAAADAATQAANATAGAASSFRELISGSAGSALSTAQTWSATVWSYVPNVSWMWSWGGSASASAASAASTPFFNASTMSAPGDLALMFTPIPPVVNATMNATGSLGGGATDAEVLAGGVVSASRVARVLALEDMAAAMVALQDPRNRATFMTMTRPRFVAGQRRS